jgi:beta-lactam-binding protein with PASTA domain
VYIKQFFLNLIPFIGFLCGHILIWQIQKPKVLACPSFIGLSLLEGSMKATQQKVYLKVIKTITDDGIVPGTILMQYPKEKSFIKEQQIVYISVSIITPPLEAPPFLNKKLDTLYEISDITTLTIDIHHLCSSYPASIIFAQNPLPGKIIQNNKVTIYVQRDEDPLYVIPNLTGHTLQDVTEIFDLHQIPYTCDPMPIKKNAIILDQRPVAGTIVSKKNLKMIYLHCLA